MNLFNVAVQHLITASPSTRLFVQDPTPDEGYIEIGDIFDILALGSAAYEDASAFAAAVHTHAIADTTGLQAALDAKQGLDATLSALAALTIAANSLTIGSGADAFSQTTFAANTFLARASAGDLGAKAITDFGLSLVDDADAAAARTTLGAVSKTGGDIIVASAPNVAPLQLQGAGSQTASLFRILSSGSSTLIDVNSGGTLIANTGLIVAGTLDPIITATAGDQFRRPLLIKGAASQSAHLTDWQNSAGTLLMSVSENGFLKNIKTSVIADAELDANEYALYWDPATYTIKGRGKNASGVAAAAFFELPNPIFAGDIRLTLGSGVIRFGGSQVLSQVDSGSSMRLALVDKVYIKPQALAATNTVVDHVVFGLDSTGTPAAGFGEGVLLRLHSSTTIDQNAARIVALWDEATHASRKGALVLSAYDVATERVFLKGAVTGSAASLGFLGATPVARQALVSDPTGGATVDAEARTAIAALIDVLINFGLMEAA